MIVKENFYKIINTYNHTFWG